MACTFGHTNHENYVKTAAAAHGLPTISKKDDGLCGGCSKCKKAVTRFPKSQKEMKTSQALQLVHLDLMGSMNTTSYGGAKYVLTFVDDFFRYKVVYNKFCDYKALMENQ